MGLAQDLQQYGLGRATVRDVAGVEAAASLVSDVLEFLLQLDFRNGPLRRKYDGCKWSLRALETLLYELEITNTKGNDDRAEKEPIQKRGKTESSLLPNDALSEIKKRMDHRDALREQLIKKCRDGQKAAKQAIFALHRGDKKKAAQLLEKCEVLIEKELYPIVKEEGGLRSGSFANMLEEYAEAKLFLNWLGDSEPPSCVILLMSDFPVTLTSDEYVGGLCDLTGEVGRYAVQRGTVRDTGGVQLCLETNNAILSSLLMMEQWPHSIGKKLQEVRRSVEKLQRILYEMSLSEAAGGRDMKTEIDMAEHADVDNETN